VLRPLQASQSSLGALMRIDQRRGASSCRCQSPARPARAKANHLRTTSPRRRWRAQTRPVEPMWAGRTTACFNLLGRQRCLLTTAAITPNDPPRAGSTRHPTALTQQAAINLKRRRRPGPSCGCPGCDTEKSLCSLLVAPSIHDMKSRSTPPPSEARLHAPASPPASADTPPAAAPSTRLARENERRQADSQCWRKRPSSPPSGTYGRGRLNAQFAGMAARAA
jgi:hypothetical protein